MARKIAVYNKKGGVAKTTDAVNLAASLAAMKKPDGSPKYRVLLNDMDPQQDASNYLGVGSYFRSEEDENRDLGLVLKGEKSLSEVMYTYRAKEWVGPNTKGDDVFEVTEVTDFDDDGQEIKVTRKYREVEIPNFKICAGLYQHRHGQASGGRELRQTSSGHESGRPGQPIPFRGVPGRRQFPREPGTRSSCRKSSRRSRRISTTSSSIVPVLGPALQDGGPGQRPDHHSLDAWRVRTDRGSPGHGTTGLSQAAVRKKPDLIFAVMNKIRGNVPRHIAYWRKTQNSWGASCRTRGSR